MFEEFCFSGNYLPSLIEKLLKYGISPFPNSEQANTIHESIPPAKAFLPPPALRNSG
jgi:hypothetical protein